MRYLLLILALAVGLTACHPGPVVDTTPRASVGGTIAGSVTTTDPLVALPGRAVTAIEASSGEKYAAVTATNGGYTLKVPEGTYRLEVELRGAEALAKRPGETRINNGDLDPGRDFVITAARPAR